MKFKLTDVTTSESREGRDFMIGGPQLSEVFVKADTIEQRIVEARALKLFCVTSTSRTFRTSSDHHIVQHVLQAVSMQIVIIFFSASFCYLFIKIRIDLGSYRSIISFNVIPIFSNKTSSLSFHLSCTSNKGRVPLSQEGRCYVETDRYWEASCSAFLSSCHATLVDGYFVFCASLILSLLSL